MEVPVTSSRLLNPLILDSSGDLVLGLRGHYKHVPRNSDIIHIVQLGDRLDKLSLQYYGTITLWWLLADINDLSDLLFDLTPGQQLVVPDRSIVFLDLLGVEGAVG